LRTSKSKQETAPGKKRKHDAKKKGNATVISTPDILSYLRLAPTNDTSIAKGGGIKVEYPEETYRHVTVTKNLSLLVTGREGFRVTHGHSW